MNKQLIGEYKYNNPVLIRLLDLARSLLQQFAKVAISHVPQSDNEVANKLAQQASTFWLGLSEINNIEITKTQQGENKD